MKYNKKIIFMEQVISKVLNIVHQPSLFKNNDFKLLKGNSNDVIFSLIKRNSIELTFWLDCGELRIDLDRTRETFTVSYSDIKENEQQVVDYLTMVFTSTINVEHCGKHYTKLTFISGKGEVLDTLSYRDAIFAFRRNCQEKVYSPIYRE